MGDFTRNRKHILLDWILNFKQNIMNIYIKLTILIVILCLVSCEDYLERKPLVSPTDETFISTKAELEQAVTACYAPLRFSMANRPFPIFLETVSDISWGRESTDMQVVGSGAHDARTDAFLTAWTYFYTGIARCNYVLTNMHRSMGVVDEALYNQREAEVRFLRALYYHYLTELFGGVPLVTKPLTLSEAQLPRTPKTEVVDFILNELEESAVGFTSEEALSVGRASKEAAWALASRVALYNEKWDAAARNAKKVIDQEGISTSLSSNYEELFQYAGEKSNEIIFSLQYLRGNKTQVLFGSFASRNANGYVNIVPIYQLADAWESVDGKSIDESPLFDPEHPFQNRDPRLGYTLAVPGSEFLGYQFETHTDSVESWNYNLNPPARIPNKDATHPYASFTGLAWRKYADVSDASFRNESELNIILIRYAEVLLNYAEAKIEEGTIDQSVLDAINKIRQRPSVNMPPVSATDQAELRNIVRRERKYELSGEGLRLFDIRRWKIAERVMKRPVLGRMKKDYPDKAPLIDELANAYYDNIPIASAAEPTDFKMRVVQVRLFNKDRDYLWPIPAIEIETNPLLEQNPNY